MHAGAQSTVLCCGEVLWDVFPDARRIGGAPFNVACHLHALGRHVQFASRIGDDDAGHAVRNEMHTRGMGTDLVQVDRDLPTGEVLVALAAGGQPSYEIQAPAAWDAIRAEPALLAAAAHASWIVHGSLTQRAPVSRATLAQLTGRFAFDVNLRPPHDDRAVVERSLRRAALVKLNDDELARLCQWFHLPRDQHAAAAAIAQRFGCRTVCVTRGAHGAALLHDGTWCEHAGVLVSVVDTVGAGDAFLAGLLDALLDGATPRDALAGANQLGARTAAHAGALPPIS